MFEQPYANSVLAHNGSLVNVCGQDGGWEGQANS